MREEAVNASEKLTMSWNTIVFMFHSLPLPVVNRKHTRAAVHLCAVYVSLVQVDARCLGGKLCFYVCMNKQKELMCVCVHLFCMVERLCMQLHVHICTHAFVYLGCT